MSEHIVGVSPKEYNGRKYRSTLEADTAKTLDALKLSWEYETRKIILQDSFYCKYQKDKVRKITYTPDFIVGPVMLETKGYETPDWNIKKKLLYKYLSDHEPNAIFYMVKNGKQLLEALDKHWLSLGCVVQVSPKPKGNKEQNPSSLKYDSIQQAMQSLHLTGKPVTPILRSLTGKNTYVYGYNWKLVKLKI